jgi:hypothetical protein
MLTSLAGSLWWNICNDHRWVLVLAQPRLPSKVTEVYHLLEECQRLTYIQLKQRDIGKHRAMSNKREEP